MEVKGMSCPGCLCDRIYKVPARWFERPLSVIGYQCYKCVFCRRRFMRGLKRRLSHK
jgi:hypothetical protein